MKADSMGHCLILGGTGFVGRALARRLAKAQGARRLLVPTRHRAHAQALAVLPQVDAVQADLHDDAHLARLLDGADAVVNLVAVLHGSEARFEQVHVALPRRLAAACAAAGVRRLVHVSALGAAADAPSRYLRSKARGEAVLRAAGLDLTVLRPSVIFGAEDRLLNLFALLQRVAPVLPLAGATARFQPVWVDDVAAALARCLADPRTIGQTFECAGPDEMTLADLVRAAGRYSGHERLIVPLPPALATLQAWAMECLPGEPLMSRDNLASMQVPNVATPGAPGLAALGIAATRLATVAPGYLGRDAWQAGLDDQRARHR